MKRTSVGPSSNEFKVVFKSTIKAATEMTDHCAIDMRLRGVFGYAYNFVRNLISQADSSEDVEVELAAIDNYIGVTKRPFVFKYDILEPGTEKSYTVLVQYGVPDCIFAISCIR